MATVYKIHPAIGIARVGNSPSDFFIGPERVGEEPMPAGGFKDAQCRVKRQAARFRVFAHHDDGSVEEISNAIADITWTVHVANKKAANPGRGNSGAAADLTIDPGAKTVHGSSQQKALDGGAITFSGASAMNVPLGEIRTDDAGHLLVLGGSGTSGSPTGSGISGFWGNADWYDDVSDGPVTASVTLRNDLSTHAVTGAWVIVTPPKFAPHQDSVVTLYDRVLDAMVAGGLVTAPTTTSYTHDVYPVLQRARDTQWVAQTFGAHTWTDPVTSTAQRNAIFGHLKAPGGGGSGDMPDLNESSTSDGRLTSVQYAHMQRWNAGTYTNDWTGAPAPEASVTPDGLDRAALEACVGGASYPGIEGGGLDATQRPLLVATNYAEPFRIDHARLGAGDLTYVMALPWQADFNACADNWWPVPRPNYVTRGGSAGQSWTAGVVGTAEEMVAKWNKLGFVVRQGSQHVEVARCDTASIDLLTPVLDFQDVPQGPMGMVREVALAITFEVIAPSSSVTLQYAPGGAPSHPQLVAFNTSTTVGPTSGAPAEARLWIIYRTSTAGAVLPPQTVTVQDAGGTQSWSIQILGNTVARKTAAAALVLDRSGSMSEDRGDGQTKHDSLQQAAGIFVDVMLEGDGVGIVRFNEDAQVLQTVKTLGSGGLSDVARSATKDVIQGNGLDPSGQTSIGDGIFEGRGILDAASGFDVKSLVVLTDGMENSARFIADVADEIREDTYAVGLGQPQNISVPALQTISGNHGGYLLVTGAIGQDNRFLLQKYFLQILAGISSAEIVLDPDGRLVPGRVERVPFQITSADSGVDVILLTPQTKVVDFRLQTPTGQILEPWRAASDPAMRYVRSDGVTYFRIALPTELQPNRFDRAGTWQALLAIGEPRIDRGQGDDGVDHTILRRVRPPPALTRGRSAAAQRRTVLEAVGDPHFAAGPARSLPYSVVVHAYSNLTLRAHVEQSGFEPGARVSIFASLAESGIPIHAGAHVWADVTRPDGGRSIVKLTARDDAFHGELTTTILGVYRLRVRAAGTTRRGEPFTREKTLTAAVWRGGDRPGGGVGGSGGNGGNGGSSGNGGNGGSGGNGGGAIDACKLLACLLERDGVISSELERRLLTAGIDVTRLRECIAKTCRRDGCC